MGHHRGSVPSRVGRWVTDFSETLPAVPCVSVAGHFCGRGKRLDFYDGSSAPPRASNVVKRENRNDRFADS